MKLLSEHGADVNQRAGFTPLHSACGEDARPKVVRFLVDRGANVDQKIWTGGTALMNAAHHGNEEIVALLLARGARTDIRDRARKTPLHEACDDPLISGLDKEPLAIVKRLLVRGANPNAKDGERRTPLHLAAKEFGEQPELVIALLRAGAKPNASDAHGKTALFYASELDQLDTVMSLLDAGARLEPSSLVNAARNGYVDLGVELLRRGAKRTRGLEAIARANQRTSFVRMLRGEVVAAEQLPRAVRAICTDAEAPFKHGKYAEVIRRYQRLSNDVLVRIPSAAANLAYAFQQTGAHDRAVTWFAHAMAVHDEPAQFWRALCFSLSELERWDEMDHAATMAAKVAPKDSYVWQQVAIARSQRKNLRGAIEAGKRAVKLNPRNAYARFNLASDRKKAGEPSTLEAFREAIALDASLAEFLDEDDKRALRGKSRRRG